jgi:hypothetical protein
MIDIIHIGICNSPETEVAICEQNYNLARVYLDSRRYREALTLLEELAKKYPGQPRFLQHLAQCYVGKWIKQHLRIKAFFWIAVSIYVLVAIVRKRLGLAASLYQTLQILSVTLFEKTPILCALQAPDADAEFTENVNQLILFDI